MTHKKSNSRQNSHSSKTVQTEMERQASVMATAPQGLYERFRRGLLEYHSEVRPTTFGSEADM
jgi:hypothetical protein